MTEVAAPEPRRPTWLLDLGLFLLVLVPCLAGSGSFSLLDVDEPRFAYASRAMCRMDPGENWIVPHFNGEERFDKPILVYWLQALAMTVFGPFERAARLPSALAIALCAPLVASIARLLGARRSGAAIAGLAMGTCALAIVMGHASTADALLLACTTTCARFQIARFVRGPSATNWLGLWLAFSAAFLTKGPAAWIGPTALGVALLWAGARPRPKSVALGFAFAWLPVLAWGIPALVLSEGRFYTVGILHHVVERGSRPFEGHGGSEWYWWFFYLGSVPITFLPWTPLLGLAEPVLDAKVAGVHPGLRRVLVGWVGIVVVAFSCSASKMVHYVLPCYPALATAVGLAIQHRADLGPTRGSVPLAWTYRILGAVVALGLPVPLFVADLVEPGIGAIAMGGVFGLACWIAAPAIARGAWFRGVSTLAIGTLIAFTTLGGRIMPALDRELVTTRMREPLSALLKPGVELMLYREVLPSLAFYLDRPVRAVEGDDRESAALRALELIGAPGTLVLVRPKSLDELKRALPTLEQKDPRLAKAAGAALAKPRLVESGVLFNRGRRTELFVVGTNPSD